MSIVHSSVPGAGPTVIPLAQETCRHAIHPTAIIATWRARRRYRAHLRRLLQVGRYMIADIGLALDEVLEETEKPFWRA
jgi:uncharacterized protein YjiS (DUF1127 family)